jgi:putative heme-binding domain-containing protein
LLSAEASDVCAAAIHSAALWRDRDALKPLIQLLSHDDPQLRRLAAMALGRIGDSEAVQPLLQTSSTDPFLSHAIVYALYEIGDVRSLPTGHPLAKQVHLMRKADLRSVSTDAYPEILPARWQKPDQEKLAHQKQRLDELAAFLPKGDAQRGEKLFNKRDRSKCITCHLKGEKGVRLGPDLTWIGAIRSERDLLEAIVFPSASIARYHEVVNVVTEGGKAVSGLLVKETVDSMFLSSAEGVVQPVAYREIERASYSNVSLMPEGLDKLLKPEEIADLVAYLKASKPPIGTLEVGK